MPPELDKFRQKFPDYADMSDMDLARNLAKKYPEAYGDILQRTIAEARPGAKPDAVVSPQQLEQKASPKGFSQKPISSHMQVMETLNAPIDWAGDVAGRAVQGFVDPNKNPTLSDVAGGLTKAVIQYATPAVVLKSAGLAGKVASKFIPGVEGGQMEYKIGKANEVLQSGLGEARGQANIYKRLVEDISPNDKHPLTGTQKLLKKIIAQDQERGITDSPIVQDAKRILGVIDNNGGGFPMRPLDRELSSIGEKTKVIIDGKPADPRYKQLFASMATDMENRTPQLVGTHTERSAPSVKTIGPEASQATIQQERFLPRAGQIEPNKVVDQKDVFLPRAQSTLINPGQPKLVEDVIKPTSAGQLIRGKDVAVRRQKGYEDLIDEFNSLTKTKRGMDGQQDINANQLMDKLKNKDTIRDSLTADDWQKIDPILRDLADMKVLPSPKGANFGSGRSLVMGAAGSLAGKAFGMDPYLTGAATTVISNGVGRLLMTEGGRNMVKAIMKVTEYSPSQKINAINGMARLQEKAFADHGRGDQ